MYVCTVLGFKDSSERLSKTVLCKDALLITQSVLYKGVKRDDSLFIRVLLLRRSHARTRVLSGGGGVVVKESTTRLY